MNENTILAELEVAITSLRTLAMVTLDMEESHPMALPEPPEANQVAAYERHMTTLSQEVTPRHRALLSASLRDYQAGFPDRAGKYLLDLTDQFLKDAEYASSFSAAGRTKLSRYQMDLRDL